MAGVVSDFTIARSATGGATVVGSVATLSLGSKSGGPPVVTDAELTIGLVTGTAVGALARIPISMRRPRSISPSWHVIVPLPLQLPCVAVADITVTPGGSTSVRVTAGESAGPRFTTDSAYERSVPAMTGSGESRFTMTRSVTVAG